MFILFILIEPHIVCVENITPTLWTCIHFVHTYMTNSVATWGEHNILAIHNANVTSHVDVVSQIIGDKRSGTMVHVLGHLNAAFAFVNGLVNRLQNKRPHHVNKKDVHVEEHCTYLRPAVVHKAAVTH